MISLKFDFHFLSVFLLFPIFFPIVIFVFNSVTLSSVLFEALLALHPQGFEWVNPIVYAYTVSISAAAYTFPYILTVPAPAFQYSVDIPDVCEKFGVVNLLKAHSVYIIGVSPVNPECRMFIQFCRRTGRTFPSILMYRL